MHYEEDPLIVYRGVQGLSTYSDRPAVIGELLDINRALWRATLEDFRSSCINDKIPIEKLDERLWALQRNQYLLSALMHRRVQKGLDFSGTYYSEISAAGTTFEECTFDDTLIHYANLHDATFKGCAFNRTIFINAYMEGTGFPGSVCRDALALGSRLITAVPSGPDGFPAGLHVDPAAMSCIWEVEHDWRGQWISHTPDVFDATWRTASERRATATMRFINDRTIRREHSNDGHDGTYRVNQRKALDPLRGVLLIGGTRVLRSGVPAAWYAVWWTGIDSKSGASLEQPHHSHAETQQPVA